MEIVVDQCFSHCLLYEENPKIEIAPSAQRAKDNTQRTINAQHVLMSTTMLPLLLNGETPLILISLKFIKDLNIHQRIQITLKPQRATSFVILCNLNRLPNVLTKNSLQFISSLSYNLPSNIKKTPINQIYFSINVKTHLIS